MGVFLSVKFRGSIFKLTDSPMRIRQTKQDKQDQKVHRCDYTCKDVSTKKSQIVVTSCFENIIWKDVLKTWFENMIWKDVLKRCFEKLFWKDFREAII